MPQARWTFFSLLALLIWAPLPLGSNRSWSAAVLAVVATALCLASAYETARRGRSVWAYLVHARFPLGALVVLGALLAAQWGGLGELSSADSFQTRNQLLLTVGYLGLFLLILLEVRDSTRLRLAALVIVASGVLQALTAIVLLSTSASYQFLYEDMRHGVQATGTFVNRNHLAAHMYLALAAGIGLLIGSLASPVHAPRKARDHAVEFLKFALSPRMALRVLLVVMVIALVLTRSRMGNTAFFTSLLLLGVVVAWVSPLLRRKALLLVVSLLIVDIVVVGQWVGLERVLERIDGTALGIEDARTEETVEARLEPARRTIPMIAERPWFGHGGGTYYTAFPPFKDRAMLLHLYHFDHAHNDYAEIAADVGVIGLGMLAIVVLASLHRVRKLLSPRQPPLHRGVAYGALMATTCILIHGTVDFNLHIPANAFTYTAILGLLWAVPRSVAAKPKAASALAGGTVQST